MIFPIPFIKGICLHCTLAHENYFPCSCVLLECRLNIYDNWLITRFGLLCVILTQFPYLLCQAHTFTLLLFMVSFVLNPFSLCVGVYMHTCIHMHIDDVSRNIIIRKGQICLMGLQRNIFDVALHSFLISHLCLSYFEACSVMMIMEDSTMRL